MGHGTILEGRYRLTDRQPVAGTTGERWRGRDDQLDRDVSIIVLPAGDPRAEEVLDAARRRTVVEDTRLEQVLDVGRTTDVLPGCAFVVAEHVEGQSLDQLLGDGALPPDLARTIVGEAAQALQTAARRGLHHCRLTPAQLVRRPDGRIVVLGTAVEEALAGAADQQPLRTDAAALVALLYAALTGRWPLPDAVGLPAAPRVSGAPAKPGELLSGVPADLDRLCAAVLGRDGQGPGTPGDVARALAPWHPPVEHDDADEVSQEIPADLQLDPAAPVTARALARHHEGARFEPVTVTLAAAGLPGRLESADEAEPPVPFGPAVPVGRPPQDQSRFVLWVVGAAVVVVLALASFALRDYGEAGTLVGEITATAPPTVPRAAASPTPSLSRAGSGSATPSTRTAAPFVPVGAQALDPEGDGSENGNRVTRAIDGNPASSWQSSQYRSAQFSGLKSGLGLLLDLGSPRKVTAVTVTAPGRGGALQLRSAPGPGFDGSVVLASGTTNDGAMELVAAKPVTTQYLVLWFTSLPTQDGRFRAAVAEVLVR